MRSALVGLLLAGCYCSHSVEPDDAAPPPDAPAEDAAPPVFVSGCDDPALWSAALPEVEAWFSVGGEPCTPPQYPLHVARLFWDATEGPSPEAISRTCWRVTAAAEGSGWRVGDVVSGGGVSGGGVSGGGASGDPGGQVAIVGFERPVRFEGRLIGADGRAVVAVREGEVALAPLRRVAESADVRAIVHERLWATADSIVANGEPEPIGAFVDVTADRWRLFILRGGPDGWTLDAVGRDGAASPTPLGEASRARLARGGAAVGLDDVVWARPLDDVHEVSLPGPPDELVVVSSNVCGTLADGGLFCHSTRASETRVSSLGSGRLVQGEGAPYLFDGETFHGIAFPGDAPDLDPARSFRPAAADLAAIGAPIAVYDGVVIGTEGFLDARSDDGRPGPRFALLDDVMAAGTITAWGADEATYAVRHDDGTSAVYRAPFENFCE